MRFHQVNVSLNSMLKVITDFLLLLKKKSPEFRGFFIFDEL